MNLGPWQVVKNFFIESENGLAAVESNYEDK